MGPNSTVSSTNIVDKNKRMKVVLFYLKNGKRFGHWGWNRLLRQAFHHTELFLYNR